MKKIIVFIAIIIIGYSYSFSQNAERTLHRFEQLKEFLSLNEEQAIKVKDILIKADEQAIKENSEVKKNKRTSLRDAQIRMKEIDKKIEAILTPEQLKKYESYKIERKSEMKGRRKGTKYYRD